MVYETPKRKSPFLSQLDGDEKTDWYSFGAGAVCGFLIGFGAAVFVFLMS